MRNPQKSVAILLFALIVGSLPSAFPVSASEHWNVDLKVVTQFPEGVQSEVSLELVYPLPENARLMPTEADQFETGGNIYQFKVVPMSMLVEAPSHLILHVRSQGFTAQTVNTGIMEYTAQGAASVATVEIPVQLVPNGLPEIQNVIELKSENADDRAFEISVLNPSAAEIGITRVAFMAGLWGNAACSAEAALYDVQLEIRGESIIGDAVEVGGAEKFSYPIRGRLVRYCFSTWMEASFAINLPVPPKSRSFLKILVRKPKTIELMTTLSPNELLLLPDKTDEILRKARKDSTRRKVNSGLVDEAFHWSFGFQFDQALTILHNSPESGGARALLMRETARQ